MGSPLISLTQDQQDLIKQGSSVGNYYFLPFWFEEVTGGHLKGTFKMHNLENIPKELIDLIKTERNENRSKSNS